MSVTHRAGKILTNTMAQRPDSWVRDETDNLRRSHSSASSRRVKVRRVRLGKFKRRASSRPVFLFTPSNLFPHLFLLRQEKLLQIFPNQSNTPPKHRSSNTCNTANLYLETFHRFPDLPAELRQMIFEACIPRRIVQVLYCSEHLLVDPEYIGVGGSPEAQRVRSELSRMILVSKEAYDVVLWGRSIYNIPMTPWTIPMDNSIPQHPFTLVPVLFSPKIDIVWVGGLYNLFKCQGRRHERIAEIENGPFSLIAHPKSTVAIDWHCLMPDCEWASLSPPDKLENKEFRQAVFNNFVLPQSHCMIILDEISFWTENEHAQVCPGPRLRHGYTDNFPTMIDFQDEVIQKFVDIPDCEDFNGWDQSDNECGIYLPKKSESKILEHEDTFPVRKQKALALCLHSLHEGWLAMNGCFDHGAESLVPFVRTADEAESDMGYRRPGIRHWDKDHPLAKELLARLPTFSFGFAVGLGHGLVEASDGGVRSVLGY